MNTPTLTVESFRRLAQTQKKTRAKGTRRNKYGARKCHGYASCREWRRALQLREWQQAGLISGLREQVSFVLIPAQYGQCGTDFKGRPTRVLIERSCRYVADFVYEMDGQTVVEDTKGVRTKEYIIKRKLMLERYGIRIKEI